MSARSIYETAPLGSLIRFSNGEPRPPARFSRKLRAWGEENGTGRLVERVPGYSGASYRSPPTFVLHLGNFGRDGGNAQLKIGSCQRNNLMSVGR